jgi:hypothetical protein
MVQGFPLKRLVTEFTIDLSTEAVAKVDAPADRILFFG